MRYLFILLFLVSSCGGDDQPQPRENSPAPEDTLAKKLLREDSRELRGYKEINSYLRNEIVESEDFDIARYLEEKQSGFERLFSSSSLSGILGSSKGDGMKTARNGAEPNATNALLWNIVIESFSSDLEKWCSNRSDGMIQNITLRQDFADDFEPFCDKEEAPIENLETIYDWFLGYQGEYTHLNAWQRFQKTYINDSENKEPIHNLVYTLMYSPEFLIRR